MVIPPLIGTLMNGYINPYRHPPKHMEPKGNWSTQRSNPRNPKPSEKTGWSNDRRPARKLSPWLWIFSVQVLNLLRTRGMVTRSPNRSRGVPYPSFRMTYCLAAKRSRVSDRATQPFPIWRVVTLEPCLCAAKINKKTPHVLFWLWHIYS